MGPSVYIFGYQSILGNGSLQVSVRTHADHDAFLPARLRGWRRDWSAVRRFDENESKRYVHTEDWRIAPRVAFANIVPQEDAFVNGICHRISAGELDALDFREQGYTRLDVSARIEPYAGFEYDGSVPCFAYVDHEPDPQPALVSEAYREMGVGGALRIAEVVPSFHADYLTSTDPPQLLARDLAFVYFSRDARHLWLLNEGDSSLVLLLRFSEPQFDTAVDHTWELQRHVTEGLNWLDLRHRSQSLASSHPRIPTAMVGELFGDAPSVLCRSTYWLCRLAALASEQCGEEELRVLVADEDYWVRRAAKAALDRSCA